MSQLAITRLRGVLAAVITLIALADVPASAAEPDQTAVLAVNNQFYLALNKMFAGDATLIEAVWSHAEDTTYMGPTGGFEHGWAAIFKNWQGQATMKLGGRVATSDVHVVAGPQVAVVSNYEIGENTNANGKVEQLKLRATNIYRKETGQWKMVGHHTDPLPYLAK